MGVCIGALYWYTNWPKLIEFIEVWRAQGATKFYFYYQSVSREVYEVFKAYEKLVRFFSYFCNRGSLSWCCLDIPKLSSFIKILGSGGV